LNQFPDWALYHGLPVWVLWAPGFGDHVGFPGYPAACGEEQAGEMWGRGLHLEKSFEEARSRLRGFFI
jgi:hypothetical protein